MTPEKASEFAQKRNLPYFETSEKKNIKDGFSSLVEKFFKPKDSKEEVKTEEVKKEDDK